MQLHFVTDQLTDLPGSTFPRKSRSYQTHAVTEQLLFRYQSKDSRFKYPRAGAGRVRGLNRSSCRYPTLGEFPSISTDTQPAAPAALRPGKLLGRAAFQHNEAMICHCRCQITGVDYYGCLKMREASSVFRASILTLDWRGD